MTIEASEVGASIQDLTPQHSPVAAFLLQRVSGAVKEAVELAGTVGGLHTASVLVNQT